MSVAERAAQRLDLEGVRAHLEKLAAEGQVGELIGQVIGLLTVLRDRNTQLELDVARLVRKHLHRTSERVPDAQLSLLAALLAKSPDAPLGPPAAELPAPPKAKKPKNGHGRSPLPPHLPRVEIPHQVPEAERRCPKCGEERRCIGHESSEVLEFVPASFHVEVHQREKLACPDCEAGVATAPVPPKVIDKGRPGPGLLAQVMVAKYADHMPLSRQRKIYAREGVELPVSTMVDWVAAFHECVQPLCARIGEHALASAVLAADDTGIKVLDRAAPGGAKRGHLWCYVGDATWSVFRYTPDWTKEGPQSFLETRRGWLQADAYKGYDGLFARPGATAIEVACHAHARRPFAELALAGDARAAPVIAWYKALYLVEEQATLDGVGAEERLARRQRDSQPLVDALTQWCIDVRGRYPPSDTLAKAAGYVINQNRALRRFLEDGRLSIDSTLVERRLRPIACGRVNYLFCGSDTGAERAASAYTLLGCCALTGVDPRAYLTWLLSELHKRPVKERIDELLPAGWAKVCPETARVRPSR